MKRIMTLGLILLGTIYLLPFITFGKSAATDKGLTKETGTVSESVIDELFSSNGNKSKDWDKNQKVTVLIAGEVKELTMEEYLPGVLAAEIPASFPVEALKAQAVAARTYAVYKKKLVELGSKPPESHKGAVLCDDPKHCKGYVDLDAKAKELWGSKADEYVKIIKNAVKDTDGVIVTYDNQPIAAVFHAAAAKKTESAADVWGTATPYLKSVDSPGGDVSPRYIGTVELTGANFKEKFLKQYPTAKLNTPIGTWFKASKRSQAGGVISVEVGGVRVSGIAIREMFSLNSTNFTLSYNNDSITFHTTGYGHGVGLSQYGARLMALEGKTYEDIVKWYYQGVTLKKLG
ncbi:MAG: stage II sporulation protein D [Clostridiales bacterium]|nr:stage II sporulation protein D [Clostridiales bacterium]